MGSVELSETGGFGNRNAVSVKRGEILGQDTVLAMRPRSTTFVPAPSHLDHTWDP